MAFVKYTVGARPGKPVVAPRVVATGKRTSEDGSATGPAKKYERPDRGFVPSWLNGRNWLKYDPDSKKIEYMVKYMVMTVTQRQMHSLKGLVICASQQSMTMRRQNH